MDWNKNMIRQLRGLIVFTVVVVVAGVNYRRLLGLLGSFFHILFPFILGGAIAFCLNVPMRNIERHLPCKGKAKAARRPVALLLSIFAVAGIVFIVTFVVGPELFRTLASLQKSVPTFFANASAQINEMFANNPQIEEFLAGLQVDWGKMFQNIMEFLKSGAGSMLSTTFSAAVSIANGLTTFVIAFIFSIYILLQKERLARQFHLLLSAYLPKKVVERVVYVAVMAERTFSSFLAGQCVEAVILGTMFFVTLTVIRLPYALLIGVLIAFTALIPVFGAFIGLGVGVFLMLVVNPMDAVIFTVVFFVLQQIEGNLIYPHVVGGSVGLPSIWVLAAVTVGGSVMGVAGMLLFIPLCSVFYALLREDIYSRITKETES